MNTKLLIQVLTLALTYGIPAVINIVKTWDKDSVTAEDIEALKANLKRPEDY